MKEASIVGSCGRCRCGRELRYSSLIICSRCAYRWRAAERRLFLIALRIVLP